MGDGKRLARSISFPLEMCKGTGPFLPATGEAKGKGSQAQSVPASAVELVQCRLEQPSESVALEK